MFKIESYITSIILANADRYIKNFRKQDAQVSLWEGDATFHNIDLNVDALNEELQSSFVFTSGYIHDLIIHVPWTKLMSEPVTISVNTIECVMRLKSYDEKIFRAQEKPTSANSESKETNEKRSHEEISNQSSYTSALTSKIMSNLSIRCENVILKLVEEDIVFSMNIEKLTFDNVNENWIQSMTDVNIEKLLTRKLITLSGVTICLDKQNSSGRIDTYLEPLLYRCQIHIRLLRAYNRTFSKKPVYTRFDILSDRMSFTVSEPQIPMLLKLGVLIFCSNDNPSTVHSRSLSFNSDSISTKSEGSHLYEEGTEENADMTSWGNWLWSMVPSILPQDEDPLDQDTDADSSCTFHVGFYVKCLETNLKVLRQRVKKSSKMEFNHLLKGSFNGCIYQMVSRNSEWLNVQFGVNYVSLEMPSQEVNDDSQKHQFIAAGLDSASNLTIDTLFDEKSFNSKIHQNEEDFEDSISFSQTHGANYDFLYNTDFSLGSHLNLYTENVLLEKSQAFAIDYVKTYQKSKVTLKKESESDDAPPFSDNESVDEFVTQPKLNSRMEKHFLLRFVFGSTVVKVDSDVIDSLRYLRKIIPCNEYSTLQQTSTGGTESDHYSQNKYPPNHITHFTFFDLVFEFHPTFSQNQILTTSRSDSTFLEVPTTIPSPFLLLSCKCIDGKIHTVRSVSSDVRGEVRKITALKAVEVVCCISKLGQKTLLAKCQKFDLELTYNILDTSRELRIETKNLTLSSSKSNLLLSYYIYIYVWSSFLQLEQKMNYFEKIFHSSLIEDSYLLGNVILEIMIESIVIKYNSFKETSNINFLINNCKAYANELKRDFQKRVIIFNAAESCSESSCIHVIIQRCKNCNEKCNYPSSIWFNICDLKINLDVIIYSWITYQPVPISQGNLNPIGNKSVKEQSVSKSAPSRKISEGNSGSHGRRLSGNFPKPKESVHSSSEHEALSPPVITETETSDVFQLPSSSPLLKKETPLIEYLKNNIPLWRSLVVHGSISQVVVYIPTSEFTHHNNSENIEHLIKESFKSHTGRNAKFGVFFLTLKSAKIKCDLPLNVLEELHSEHLISFSKVGWSADKLTFPWTISLSEICLSTLLENCVCKPLLKPLSANCTVGVSIKEGNENESIIALCVHVDFQSIIVTLTDKQVNLIVETFTTLITHYKSWREIALTRETGAKMMLSQSQTENVIYDKVRNKLTGWIQWTFTKCSLILHSKHHAELKKLCVELEDSIISLEFDDIFHKMKLKVASFGIYHHTRPTKNDPWQNGPFYGVIVQRSYSQPQNIDKKSDEDSDDRFLLVTITRAKSKNLKTRLLSSPSSDSFAFSSDRFVTEVILKICPTDVIIPLVVLETFLALLIPIKRLVRTDFYPSTTTSDNGNKEQNASACLPLVYLDVSKIRVFLPLSGGSKNELHNLNDTVVCEIGSAHLDCHPENPIIRKPLHHELYYTISGKSYSSIEHKLQNQQYQLLISDVSVNTGIWYEIQKMLEKEHLSVEEPPSAFEQNPAVMWNQGCQPDSKHKINLRHLSPIVSRFSCQILLAPPVESHSLKTIAQRAHYEIAVLSDVNVTISLDQITLLVLITREFMNSVHPYFEIVTDVKVNIKLPSEFSSGKSKIVDSGIESMDQSSAESSVVIKNKSGHANSVNSKIFYSAASSNVSGLHQQSGYLKRYENVKEIYVSMQNINFIFYKTCEIGENDEAQIVYDPLLCVEIVQPYVVYNYENNFSSLQFSIFNASIRLPVVRSVNSYFAYIPSAKDFPKMLLLTKKSNCDPFSRIKYPCFTLKTTLDLNKRWKNEIILGQPLLVNCDINAIRYILSTMNSCTREYENLLKTFEQVQEKRDQSIQTSDEEIKFIDRYKRYFHFISNSSVTTNRIVLVFKSGYKSRNLLLNVDGIVIKAKAPCVMKNLSESICLQSTFKCISLLLPEIRSTSLPDLLADDGSMQKLNDILSNMILKPWNVNVEFFAVFQRWNLFENTPWTCLKIHSDSIVLEVNPLYLDFVSNLVSEYRKLYEAYSPESKEILIEEKKSESNVTENYKDDLRAGAFQYIKNEIDKYELPSPYEVVFCNRPLQPYMCWRYPQPRSLTKLQIYPVPVEDMNDDYLEEEIRCQLQYYDEMRGIFLPHVSFNLSENSIQTVNLPDSKPYTNAAECWRIVLYDMTDSRENVNNLRIDVRSLAGCVRVDSAFQPLLVPERQMLINITEIQVNFSTLNRDDLTGIENYTVFHLPAKQHFLSIIFNDLKMFISCYNDSKDKVVEMSGIFKTNILNYEYLMFQSFVDPVFFECAIYFAGNTTPKMTGLVKNVRIHISPNFIHTLSISKDLWNDWKPNSFARWRITSHYVVCNNTNHLVTFGQENALENICLPPFACYLYAWHSPALPKSIKITVSPENKEFHSGPVQIKKIGCNNAICENTDKTEISHLFVSVVKHSSVVNQVIIYGNLLIYNLIHSEMEMVMISHGKRDAKFSYSQTINTTTIKRNQLVSIAVPDSHKLSFKVRYRPSQNSSEHCYWSGLIPLVTFQQPSNQNSWMVKVPMKNLKENFQSLWCQITREVIDDAPKYLVVFRPLCSVISFLPWKSYIQVVNDVGSVVSSGIISDKGTPTELFVPNTVSLDKFSIEWKATQENEKYSKKVLIDKLTKQKSPTQEWSIHSLIEEISVDMEDTKWPFLEMETSRFIWKSDKVYEITPTVNVFRKEENGCGTKIEIYPWAIVVNMLSYRVLLDISDTIYTIESYEIIAPPCIESTFKLGIVDGKDYLSGTLQLSDDQSFPIPKVTGRIPMNGFVTTMIECDAYVTFVNISSKNYKEMRIINVCSSYVISNKSSLDISCAALVVCRTGDRSSISFDIPKHLEAMSIELPAKQNSTVAQPIAKWYKIGKGDVQVLPYLILSIKGNAACPVRICDLSEKQRYSILFSCTSDTEKQTCIFMTAQQNQGQVFLTIWDEQVPQIVIHNMSQLSLNITSSKSDRASAEVSHCSDWNWKFSIVARNTGFFHISQQVVENKKKILYYLKFAVKDRKPVKQTKWSCGVPLKPCVNQLITLPLSQHHIKLAIFKDGFTYVVWIESATSDELSAKMIRTRLSESFLPINGGGLPPACEMSTNHTEDSNEIPQKLVNLYSKAKTKPYDLNVVIEQISLTVACDDEITFIENDVTTFTMEAVQVNLSTVQKPNEVKEDICCCVDVASYRVDNEQFHMRTFDFPVVLLSKSPNTEEHLKPNFNLRDLLLTFKPNDYSAMKIVVGFNSKNLFSLDVRDLDVMVNSQDIFLEDKYLKMLKRAVENIFSATYDSSLLCMKSLSSSVFDKNSLKLNSKEIEVNTNHFVKNQLNSEFPAKPKSSSSKSVNVSEYDTDDKSYNSMITAESNVQNDDNVSYVAAADVDEIEGETVPRNQRTENPNYAQVPATIVALSRRIAKPLRLRSIRISGFCATVSLHTSTTFYIALDRSPLNFSEFKKDYLITTPFELGNLLTVHYFFGAVYGTGWAISSLEFVGSPGVLARTLGTGIKDFVSMPIYGIASGPRGFVLGVAHGSASLMKHVMAGTLSSVTKFAGSWARTLDRFTLDADDLLQSEEIRRFPPSSIAEGVLQGLTEFGISVLGGISGLAHHPLQYAVSSTGNRSLINSISLGIVGVLTRPLSGAAELVAKTGQGILSHVGWNTVPMIRNGPIYDKNFSHLQICTLKYQWNPESGGVLLVVEAVSVLDVTVPLWITLTSTCLNISQTTDHGQKMSFDIGVHEFRGCDADPTLISIFKPTLILKNAEDFRKARIMKFISETNHCCNIENPFADENTFYSNGMETVSSFYVNPRVKNFLLNMISFVKNISQ